MNIFNEKINYLCNMETLVINILDKKSALVKQLLKELGVTIDKKAIIKTNKAKTPNSLTIKTIENAHKGIGPDEPIKCISEFINSI